MISWLLKWAVNLKKKKKCTLLLGWCSQTHNSRCKYTCIAYGSAVNPFMTCFAGLKPSEPMAAVYFTWGRALGDSKLPFLWLVPRLSNCVQTQSVYIGRHSPLKWNASAKGTRLILGVENELVWLCKAMLLSVSTCKECGEECHLRCRIDLHVKGVSVCVWVEWP